jgi:hypothetical protein
MFLSKSREVELIAEREDLKNTQTHTQKQNLTIHNDKLYIIVFLSRITYFIVVKYLHHLQNVCPIL